MSLVPTTRSQDVRPHRRDQQINIPARVLWWSAAGYGFAALADGTSVFVHASALPDGVEGLEPDAALNLDIVATPRGLRAVALRAPDEPAVRRQLPPPPPVDAQPQTGRVTRFLHEKGFGFVELDDGSEAFLHARAVEKAGIRPVQEGDRVEVTLSHSTKGRPQVELIRYVE